MEHFEIGIAGKVPLPAMPISCRSFCLRRLSHRQKQERLAMQNLDEHDDHGHRPTRPRQPRRPGRATGSPSVRLVNLVQLQFRAWGAGQCSEWLEAIEAETSLLTGPDEAALRACDFAVDEYARWTVRRTEALLRHDQRLPSARSLRRALDAAEAAVAVIGDVDHLYRRHHNIGGGCMVMGRLPNHTEPRRMAKRARAGQVLA
jgi:hypothetical protein